MDDFVYEIPTKVYFGKSGLEHLTEEVTKFGKTVLLCYGGGSIKKSGLYDKITELLKGCTVLELKGIEPNPRIASVREGVKICKEQHVDVVLAVGGGSVLDCAKFVTAGALYDGDPWELLTHRPAIKACLPLVTVLTLSATGSEMDNCGVISNPETHEKLGKGYNPMRPRVSFLNPENTYSVSPYQTACGAADILSHIIEVYFGKEPALYMVDGFMESLMRTVIRYAPIAMQDPTNYEARANLMWASSWAINDFIACGNDTAWSCHPMEHELSAYYDITHGLGLAILTPRWLEFCLSEKTASRYRDFGVNVFGIDPQLSDMEIGKLAIQKLSDFLFGTLGLKSTLSSLGIDETHFAAMAKAAVKNGGTKDAYVPLSPADVEAIYKKCL